MPDHRYISVCIKSILVYRSLKKKDVVVNLKLRIKKLIDDPKDMSRDYVNNLYSLGMVSDDNALIHPPKHCTVDVNRPRVIEIGDSASITVGVTIGNNVVIGANTLINKDVPDNCVVVGNPQHVVSDIDSYLKKHRAAQLDEAADLYDCWRRNSPEGKREVTAKKHLLRVLLAFRAKDRRRPQRPFVRGDHGPARHTRAELREVRAA